MVASDDWVLGHHADQAVQGVIVGPLNLDRRRFFRSRKSVPIETRRRRKRRQRCPSVPGVECNMRFGNPDESVNCRLGRRAAGRKIVLQRPRGPRLRGVRKDDDPQLRVRHTFGIGRGGADQ